MIIITKCQANAKSNGNYHSGPADDRIQRSGQQWFIAKEHSLAGMRNYFIHKFIFLPQLKIS